MLAVAAFVFKNGGSAFDLFYDSGITVISFYGNTKEMLTAFATLAAEETLTVNKYISDRGINFFTEASVKRSERLSAIAAYDSNIPILVVDDKVGPESLKTLSTLGQRVYTAFSVLKYAVLKNAVIAPVRQICPEAAVVYIRGCYLNHIKNKSDYENLILNKARDTEELTRTRLEYCYGGDGEYYDACFNRAKLPTFSFNNGIPAAQDITGKYLNITNGFRHVTDAPLIAERNVYFVGGSLSYGYRMSDADTIESRLQGILNNRFPGKYAVSNIVCKGGHSISVEAEIIKRLPIKPGDVVVLITDDYGCLSRDNNITPFTEDIIRVNAVPFFQRPHDMGEVFVDQAHMNGGGNQKYAEIIFEALEKNNAFEKNTPSFNAADRVAYAFPLPDDPELKAFLVGLNPFRRRGTNGAVIMEANPFTLGHRYLIEYAAKSVDNLYIFVAGDDRGFFPLEDRIDLARKGVEGLKNVLILPGGRFILSHSAYSRNEAALSAAIDLLGSKIAPILNLSVLFAGEPADKAASRYSEIIKPLLPKYGVRYEDIPRKGINGDIISAELVRELIREGDYKRISALVPESTLLYLNTPKAALCREASIIYDGGIDLESEDETVEEETEDSPGKGLFGMLAGFFGKRC
jgi:[citrate (pro-3S)-lyase] ligase